MPNWCYNTLTLDTSNKESMSKILNKKNEVDFSLILPMPESVRNTESGSSNDRDTYVYLSEKLTLTPEQVYDRIQKKEDAGLCEGYYSVVDLDRIERECKDTTEYFSKKTNMRHIPGKPYSDPGVPDTLDLAYAAGKNLVENKRQYGAATWYDWACKYWGTKWNACDTNIDGNHIRFETAWCPPYEWLTELAKTTEFMLKYYIEGGLGGRTIYALEGEMWDEEYAHKYYDILDADDAEIETVLEAEEEFKEDLDGIRERDNKARIFYSIKDLVKAYPKIYSGRRGPRRCDWDIPKKEKEVFLDKYTEITGCIARISDSEGYYLVEVAV